MRVKLLADFEARACIGPYAAAKVLGLSSAGYMHMRSGRRPIRDYIRLHVELLMQVRLDHFERLVQERTHGG